MESTERIAESELTPRLKAAVSAAEQGQVVPIEYEGREGAAIVDLTDHRLLRAYARSQTQPFAPDPGHLPTDESLEDVNLDDRYDLAMAYYQSEVISAGRFAEILGLPWAEVQWRCSRLGIPLNIGHTTLESLRAEVEAALAWDGARW